MSFEPTETTFDVAVIGGGITGAGAARDAALRGLSCLLLEKGDFSCGTSAKTTRLVHGGLRYLERGDLHLVAESLRERETLLRMAPHLIHPIPIMLPVYRGDRRKLWQIRAGLLTYDLLSLGKGTPHYAILPPRVALRKAPFLAPDRLRGAGLFYDYQIVMPERLVLENILSARDHGADCLNYHEVTRITDEGEVFRLDVRDHLGNYDQVYRARVVINAGGVWADAICARYQNGLAPKVYPTKGTHILVDADTDHAVFTSSPRDDRLFFSLPLEGFTLVGTTDTVWGDAPELAEPDAADVDYLLEGLRKLLPGRNFAMNDVLWSYAGLRPLAYAGKSRNPSALSRRHVLHREGQEGRFVTIVGGKYTTFRKMAEEAVDAACSVLKCNRPGTTDREPLFGGGLRDKVIFREDLCECTDRMPNLPRQTVSHMVELYGRRCHEVIDVGLESEDLQQPVAPGYQDLKAQIAYAVRVEDAHHLDDVILRRLRMGLAPDRGASGTEAVAAVMARELGWNAATVRDEVERFHAVVAPELHRFRGARAQAAGA